MFAINGLFLSQRRSGIQRFAGQIVKAIDQICRPDEFIIVCPKDATKLEGLSNIKTVFFGKHTGMKWEQRDFKKYLKKNKLISINLTNTMPYFRPGIVCIHDIAYATHKEFYNSLHGRLSCFYHKLFYKKAAKSKFPIFTVSTFSKDQIISKYKVDPSRICVLGNGWDHLQDVKEESSDILTKYNLLSNEYFFTLGNLAPNKNIKYIYEVAKRNPHYRFVVSGAKTKVSNESYDILNNVIEIGYIKDEDIKALMLGCRAFIFPSIYEGFGIPPLEALSLNKKIIISSTSCLPEIFKSSAVYIDPYDYDINLEELLNEHTYGKEEILSRYRWSVCALKLYNFLNKYYKLR